MLRGASAPRGSCEVGAKGGGIWQRLDRDRSELGGLGKPGRAERADLDGRLRAVGRSTGGLRAVKHGAGCSGGREAVWWRHRRVQGRGEQRRGGDAADCRRPGDSSAPLSRCAAVREQWWNASVLTPTWPQWKSSGGCSAPGTAGDCRWTGSRSSGSTRSPASRALPFARCCMSLPRVGCLAGPLPVRLRLTPCRSRRAGLERSGQRPAGAAAGLARARVRAQLRAAAHCAARTYQAHRRKPPPLPSGVGQCVGRATVPVAGPDSPRKQGATPSCSRAACDC